MTRVDIVDRLELDAELFDALVEHALSDVPFEVCGFLTTDDGAGDKHPVHIYRIPNAARSMTFYNMDPRAMLAAMNDMDDRDREMVAIYHSHTHTEAFPSPTDVELAAYPDVAYVIVSVQNPDEPVIRAFDIRGGEITERQVLCNGEQAPTGPR